MDLIFKHGWIFLIAVTIANFYVLKKQTQTNIDKKTNLNNGYDKFFKAFLIYGNLPWVIIAIGDLSGQTNSIFDFFNPKSFNPIVLTFHLYIIIFWILGIRWIYFRNGVEFLIQHPDLIRVRGFSNSVTLTPTLIKIFFALALLGGITGMTMMWLEDFSSFPNR